MKPLPTIGLTGNIGCGKSTVASEWKRFGAAIIEGDAVGRRVVEESTEFRGWLRERFGDSIFDGDRLDRPALGRLVFTDEQARRDLDQAVWPHIRDRLIEEIAQTHRNGRAAVVDAALIYEWGDEDRYDEIVVVVCDEEAALQRAADRLGLTVREMRDRARNQIPQKEKADRADVVLENTASLRELREKAAYYWQERMLPRVRSGE